MDFKGTDKKCEVKNMKNVLIGLLAVVVIVVGVVWSSYNSLVNLEVEVDGAWAQVQVQYQRRMDLIPNLVNTAQQVADVESETFKDIAALRTGYQNASSPEELQELDRQLTSSLNIAVEAYPELNSYESFNQLMDELAGTENRIAVERRNYNEAVNSYNSKIRRFPSNIIASSFGFERKELFESTEGAEQAPVVDFN